MSTKIRLKRLGKIRTPHYRVVVMDSRAKRDGRPIEEIGQYHPKADPSVIVIDSERAQYWLGVGAQPTEAVVALLKRTGDWQKFSGDTSPSGIALQAPRPDKEALFNAALAQADNAPKGEAISVRRGRKAVQAADAITAALEETPAQADEAVAGVAEKAVDKAAAVVETAPVAAAETVADSAEDAVADKVEDAAEAVADAVAPEADEA